ncbi:MAG: hypothetical protein ABIY55_24075 [Kofleriaceae bacterium]
MGDTVWVTCRGPKRALARHALALITAAGCAHSAPLPADHPADARAPIGRLADPSPSLAPGVISYAGHAMPADAKPADAKPAAPEHHHHH